MAGAAGRAGGETDLFGRERPRLLGLAYRMLGSLADAEDVVQDAWVRWAGGDRSEVDNAAAWLTTTTTRLALDRLRTLARRREAYVGPWLPEPVVPVAPQLDPATAAELAESMTLGFLVVLDTLSPVERAVFLLADVFGEPHSAIAATVGKTEDNCRQIASRARRKVRAARPHDVSPAPAPLLARLVAATTSGDVAAVLGLLAPDVVVVSDGGARRAALGPLHGRDRVARLLVSSVRRTVAQSVGFLTVNGEAMASLRLDDRLFLMSADIRNGQVVAIRIQANPDKLTHLEHPTPLA